MKIDFKTSNYLSGIGRFFCIVLFFVSLIILPVSPILGTLIAVACLIFFTMHYRLSIDTDQKIFHDYCWVAGIKSGTQERFESIDYVFMKRNRISQTVHSRVSSAVFHQDVFDVYIRFSETQKIHLFTSADPAKARERMERLAEQLGISMVDQTA